MSRIDYDSYFLKIAKVVSERSTCIRRKYGAVIVKDNIIVSTGYNGSPRGEPNCCDVGYCYRESMNIPHGEQYERCCATHAEQNALISVSRERAIGATLYLYGIDLSTGKEIAAEPCLICGRMIKNAGIAKVVNIEGEKQWQ